MASGFLVNRLLDTTASPINVVVNWTARSKSEKLTIMALPVAYPPVDARLLDEIVARIRHIGDPIRVVLFGSHARGQAGPSSDLDLLIVEDSNLSRHRRAPRYLRALVGVFPAKDVIVWTPAEVAAWANLPNAFISTVLREGVTLYER